MCGSTCSIMTCINSNNMPFDLQRCILQYTSLWSILCVPLCCPSALCTMHFNNNKHRRLIQIGYWWSQVSATVGHCTIIPIAQHPWNIQLSRIAYIGRSVFEHACKPTYTLCAQCNTLCIWHAALLSGTLPWKCCWCVCCSPMGLASSSQRVPGNVPWEQQTGALSWVLSPEVARCACIYTYIHSRRGGKGSVHH